MLLARMKSLYQLVSQIYQDALKDKQYWYSIEEIDFDSQIVKIHVRGKHVVLSFRIQDAINDSVIINGLSPFDAACLGYSYGVGLRRQQVSPDHKKPYDFLLNLSLGSLRILCQSRDGKIFYQDIVSQNSFSDAPLDIIQNSQLIVKFDSSQACYLGILAGSTEMRENLNLEQAPYLRLVYDKKRNEEEIDG